MQQRHHHIHWWMCDSELKSSISLKSKLQITEKDFDLDVNTTSRDSFMNLHIDKFIHNNMIFSAKSLKMIISMMFHKLWDLVKKSEFYFNQERIISRFSCQLLNTMIISQNVWIILKRVSYAGQDHQKHFIYHSDDFMQSSQQWVTCWLKSILMS